MAEAVPLATPSSFDFPYPQPYEIQLDLMKTVFRAIEDKKIAIVSIRSLYDGRLLTSRSSHLRARANL
jgi:hypothetical protein